MKKKTLVSRIKNIFGFAEGSSRGTLFGQGELGNWFSLGEWEDGFQRNLSVTGRDARRIPAAYAAVMANARAVSQCFAQHIRTNDEGMYEVIRTSPASRIFHKPNDYETWSQFVTNMVAEMQFEGESFAFAVRGSDNKIAALHKCPLKTCAPFVAEDGSVYYSLGANPMRPQEQDYLVPARDILHLRNDCPRHPLIGESAIKAASLAAGINVTLSESQAAFFSQMSRPSGIISTDVTLTKEQITILREAWDEQASGLAQGKIPVLGGGMKFQPMGITSQDAELIRAQKMTIADIARVYGVPLPVIGEMEGSTMNNVEQLVSLWLSISLGALLENLEQSFEQLFQFSPHDRVELDVTALLRTDFMGRVDGLTKGVQGGLFTPNEARKREGLPPIPKGDVAYLQAQMVPVGTMPASAEPAPPAEPTPDEPTAEEVADKAVAKVVHLFEEQNKLPDESKTILASESIKQAMNDE